MTNKTDVNEGSAELHCYAVNELYPQCGLVAGDMIQRRPCGPPCVVECVERHRVKVCDSGGAYWVKWLTLNIAWKRVGM